jgi:hypothetical protein
LQNKIVAVILLRSLFLELPIPFLSKSRDDEKVTFKWRLQTLVFLQDQVHDMWVLIQNENTGPLVQKINKNFKIETAEQ